MTVIVTVPPSEITIEFDGEERRESLTVTENVSSLVKCITRLSNPAPVISWTREDGGQMPPNAEVLSGGVIRYKKGS